ncbi:unnamed protein product [Clonostachys rosea]|uniref:NACHT domain-containing protein n=1 Tax=Bionectria ochroleuca TaxID=29856 RepID=A0ABY6TWV3_BIOOC|nr:unnamed protein product [Clonostachys rosea]
MASCPESTSCPSHRQVDYSDCEVAVICALPLEAAAVNAVFDHRCDHGDPPLGKGHGDPNAYSIGVIGQHNVVLAHMPGMGKVSATTAATALRASFPHVKLALVVGVCGCSPLTSEGEEIVLGDVIISTGVVQYDLGRQMPEEFRPRQEPWDIPGRPNVEIRSYLNKLRAGKKLQEHMIRHLETLLLDPELASPGVEHDKLFEPTYRHIVDGKTCDECGCCGTLIPRARHSKKQYPPKVHFGLIASGDKVLKSGRDREDLARKNKVIGFEMEGAGVWDCLPCVIIKGACDYADSHKMKGWQKYAATTAAATLKAFLEDWPSTVPQKALNAQAEASLKQWLAKLRVTDPRDDKTRIEEAKGGLVHGAYQWVINHPDLRRLLDDPGYGLLWIKGDPGKGKTMLLCGIINELKNWSAANHLVYFFCQATDTRLNNATAVLRSLIYMLCKQNLSLAKAIQTEYEEAGAEAFEGLNAWYALQRVFSKIMEDHSLRPVIFVIDALDECQDDLPKLLDLINNNSTNGSVKWILSSRNKLDIEQRLHTLDGKTWLSLELRENAESVSRAVNAYIEHQVTEISDKWGDSSLQEQTKRILRTKAQGTFLWAALVVQELRGATEWDVQEILEDIPTGLDELYERMMLHIDQLKRENPQHCRQVLATVSTTYRPLTLPELGLLSGLRPEIAKNPERIRKLTRMCGSFLTIRDDTVFFVHQSAKDYLDRNATDRLFPSGIAQRHRVIYLYSIDEMTAILRRDIYNARHHGKPIHEIVRPDPDPLNTIRYSCVYWIDHVSDAGVNEYAQTDHDVQTFLKRKYLYWLEALALLGSLSQGIFAISKLLRFIKDNEGGSEFTDILQDMARFIRSHIAVTKAYPLQIYASGLIFTPANSQTRGLFEREEPKWVLTKPRIEGNWDACLQTLEGHRDCITTVAFSPNGRLLASGSKDHTVRVWDADTGNLIHILEGHADDLVHLVAFSPDSLLVASKCRSGKMRLWAANTGKSLHTFDHSGELWSGLFSPDSRLVASESPDHTARLWCTETGKLVQTIEGHRRRTKDKEEDDSRIIPLAYSPNGQLLVLESYSSNAQSVFAGSGVASKFKEQFERLRDTSTDDPVPMPRSSTGLESAALSPDGRLMAFGSENLLDYSIRVWAAETGDLTQRLKGHSDDVTTIAFSPDSLLMASGSWDYTVRLWYAKTDGRVEPLQNQADDIWSIAFSPDGRRAAAVGYQAVQLWNPDTGELIRVLESYDKLTSVAFSPDSKLVASGSRDNTVRIWTADTGILKRELKHGDAALSVVFSPDGQLLASGSQNGLVQLWFTNTGNLRGELLGHEGGVSSVVFSSDGSLIASGSDDRTVRLWACDGGELKLRHTLKGHDGAIKALAFSSDGQLLASGASDNTVRLWSTVTGKLIHELDHHDWIGTVALSPDGRLVASGSDGLNGLIIWLWAADTGLPLGNIDIAATPTALGSDNENKYVLTNTGAILIDTTLDTNTVPSTEIYTLSDAQTGYGISHDGSWITIDNEKVLWLPAEYRPDHSAVSGSNVAIYSASGRVFLMRFDKLLLFQ